MKSKVIKKTAEKKLNSEECNLTLAPINATRDHHMYKLYYKKTFITIFQISMGSHEFGPSLVGKMARQLGISSRDLNGIANCTFWGKDFVVNSRLIKDLLI